MAFLKLLELGQMATDMLGSQSRAV